MIQWRLKARYGMADQSLHLTIPEPLYNRLKVRAERTHRTVEAEVLEAVATAVADDELPAPVAQAVAALALADDAALWKAARSRLPQDVSHEIEVLHFKQQ